ncbi:MAG: sigma-70 family RNA polymerase sigma factor [Planctomycetota bacterium]|jgi:RNA polymerase sigma-70 factor (ECF subfamily)
MKQTDYDLVKAFTGTGSVEAFETLVDRHVRLVYHLAYRITGKHHEAEDVSQDVFLHWLQDLKKYKFDKSFRGWLAAVTKNTALQAIRSRNRRKERERKVSALSQTNGDSQPEPFTEAEKRELTDSIERSLGELPQETRIPVVLHYMEGMTYTEVGEAMDIPEGTAKSRVNRGLDQIRELVSTGEQKYAGVALVPVLEAIQPPPVPASLLTALKALPLKAAVSAGIAAKTATAAKGASMLITVLAAVAVTAAIGGGIFLATGPVKDLFQDSLSPARTLETETPGGTLDELPGKSGTAHIDASPAGEPEGKPAAGSDTSGKGSPPAKSAKVDRPVRKRPVIRKVNWIPKTLEGGGLLGGVFQPVGRWTSPPPAKGRCTLAGRVLDARGRAVPRAEIVRTKKGVDLGNAEALDPRELVKIGLTDEEGAFRAGELPAGEYFFGANLSNIMNGPKGYDLRGARKVFLAEGETMEGVVLRLTVALAECGAVEGRVVGDGLKPLQGALVSTPFLWTRTDEKGKFRLPALHAGKAYVVASYRGYERAGKTVHVPGGRALTGVDFALEYVSPGKFTLDGIVTDGRGTALEGARVLVRADRLTLRIARTDASGRFWIDRLGKKKVSVMCDKPGYLSAYRESTLPATDLNLVMVELARIRGRVLCKETRKPLKQLYLMIFREMKDTAYSRDKSVYSEDGSFEIGAETGKNILYVDTPDHGPGGFEIETPPPGEVLEDVEILLDKKKKKKK